MKSHQWCLWLGTTDLRIIGINGTHVDLIFHCPLDAGTLPALQNWAGQQGNFTFHLLLDLPEEFRLESLPPVRGKDRQILLDRRLQQLFPSTRYRHARICPTKNGQQSALLSTLTDCSWVDRITGLLQQCGGVLAGIHSVALALAELLFTACPPTAPNLLLAIDAGNTLYQALLENDGVVYVRRCVLPDRHGQEQAAGIAEETRQLSQYLATLQRSASTAQPAITLLAESGDEHVAAIVQQLSLLQGFARCQVISTQALTKRLHLPQQASWQALLMLAAGHGKLHNHYAPAATLGRHRLYQKRHVLQASTLFIALIILALTFPTVAQLRDQHNALESDQHTLETLLARQASQPRQENQAPQALQEELQLYRQYLQAWPDPEQTAQQVSQYLEELATLKLQQYRWQTSNTPTLPDESAAASMPSALPSPAACCWQIIDLDGTADLQDYRLALAELAQLQQRLKTLDRSQVRLRNPLISLDGQSQLSSDALAASSAAFGIRIVIAPMRDSRP